MAATHLIVIPTPSVLAGANQDHPVSGAQRIRGLQEQARQLAREEMAVLADDIAGLAAHAAEVSEGGEAYPPGVRELSSRIAEELGMHARVLRAIMERAAHA